MEVYKKTLYTRSFEGSIHVDNLLYLYEKIWFISFLRVPAFKKIEPTFEICSEHGEGRDLSLQDVKKTFSPDEPLSSCSFILRLPTAGDYEQKVSSITFESDNSHSILITVEGTDQSQITAVANTIVYKINPYVSSMNKGRRPPTQHEERKTNAWTTVDDKPAKPYLGMDVYEAPAIKANLSDKVREEIEKDSRKNSRFIWLVILAIVLIVAIVLIIVASLH